MGHIEATRELSASPEALWGTVTDLANWDKWFTVHEKWLQRPPDTLTGTARELIRGAYKLEGRLLLLLDLPRTLQGNVR